MTLIEFLCIISRYETTSLLHLMVKLLNNSKTNVISEKKYNSNHNLS